MPLVEDLVEEAYGNEIALTDMNQIGDALHRIAAEVGLGVAILVAWRHGLVTGHIPLEHDANGREEEEQAHSVFADDECPYVFVHVPVRRIRGDKLALTERGIMNRNAGQARLVYHENGLVGTFSFPDPGSVGLSENDIENVLDIFAQHGVLTRANVNGRQIQFTDLATRKRIEESGRAVYVRVEDKPLAREILSAELNRDDVWCYLVEALKTRTACNYCSVRELNPHEVMIYPEHALPRARRRSADCVTVRNYQMGFTYAPFGDPRTVCHFLAWDFPRIDELVTSMEPQPYSFGDLIRLVWLINRDIREFCRDRAGPPVSISGICNHWAGNSIYHQHYQFLRIADLPLVCAATRSRPLATYRDVQVRRIVDWPAPAYVITAPKPGGEPDLMRVADRVARQWRTLSDGQDPSYGNGIGIENHTQNIFVTTEGDRITAIFIPRDRRRVDTTEPANMIQKRNAGALEMLGYFLIDDPRDFAKLTDGKASRKDLKDLGDSWLSELAPPTPESIREFESNVAICLTDEVGPYEERIDRILDGSSEHPWREARVLASTIQRDERLDHRQREYLYRELTSTVLDLRTGDPA